MLRRLSFLGALCKTTTAAALVWSQNGHCYDVVMDNQSSWDQAEATAEQTGSYLATIGSAEEQQFVGSLLQERAFVSGAYWIGLKETSSEGVYAWVTGEPLSYTNWYPYEPNNGLGGTEDCACALDDRR